MREEVRSLHSQSAIFLRKHSHTELERFEGMEEQE